MHKKGRAPEPRIKKDICGGGKVHEEGCRTLVLLSAQQKQRVWAMPRISRSGSRRKRQDRAAISRGRIAATFITLLRVNLENLRMY